MNIPFLSLHSQYKHIKQEIDRAVKRVIDRQYFILGEELTAFEQEFALYLGAKYVVGVGSGTDALILSLRALGIGKGDEVITQPNSFIATTLAITEIGATPVFVDVDPNTYQIDVNQIEAKITKKTKAILPVHLYGAPCEINHIVEIAKKNKLFVIEDACQSHGAILNKRMTGTFGDIGTFSFYPGKNLGAYGDGGAICTDSKIIYDKLLKLRNYGQTKKYYHDEIGINTRLDEIQAAILRVKLKHLDIWNKKRNFVAEKYIKGFKKITVQKIIDGGVSNYHIFTIQSKKRFELSQFLKANGITTLIHYPIPIHLQKCYQFLGHSIGDFPNTEKLSLELQSIPIYPELKVDEIEYLINKINNYSY